MSEHPSLTRDQVVAEPWKYTSHQWRIVHGIHVPWIAEISPMQVGLMSKRARSQYETKRTAEWQASHDGCHAYALAVVAAFDAGKFQQWAEECTEDANTAIFGEMNHREEAAYKVTFAALDLLNEDLSDLKVGDIIYSIMGSSYQRVVKVSRLSCRTPNRYRPGDTWSHNRRHCQWLSYNDLVAHAKAGATTITRKTEI